MHVQPFASRVLAVLGPTNTGKTHFAIERMLAHKSGIMGFPLRLLAREVYDRIVRLRGAQEVALITGEEKIFPRGARYTVCTVEAMPQDYRAAFLAVDEIQLCADPERGHVFTDRLLHARGEEETVFLGAETIRPLLIKLVPKIEIVTRPRFSQLTYTGPAKLTRMPRRSAVVGFRASDVYKIAEVVRRQRGGAAVVLGALSPRTRNAQVAMYQEGEVDHLVATDAIGMGLNMDLHHVAFADLYKFDGRETRQLTPAELGQIAGRAGRHTRDGTFGGTSQVGEIDEKLIEAIENHQFAPLKQLYWRSRDLTFDNLASLRESLEAPAPYGVLQRKRDAVDELSLRLLSGHGVVRERARGHAMVRLLWQVCQVPDFTKNLTDSHIRLLERLYLSLSDGGRVPGDWIADHVARLDRTDGDIDALTARLAHIRTWAFVSHRETWLDDPQHWQERTRAVEDRLSDALHDRLTQRFVDKRTSALLRSMRERHDMPAYVSKDGEVMIDGHAVGHIEGLRFIADQGADKDEQRVLHAAARRVLGPEMAKRAKALAAASDDAFTLDGLTVRWHDHAIARLRRGDALLKPEIALDDSPHLSGQGVEAVRARLKRWLEDRLRQALGALFELNLHDQNPALRGLAYRMHEHLGNVPADEAKALLAALDAPGRKRLAKLGVRLGVFNIFVPSLLKHEALTWRRLLWSLQRARPLPDDLALHRTTLLRPEHDPLGADDYAALGYQAFSRCALRCDILERFAARLRALARDEPIFALPDDLMALTGLNREAAHRLLRDLGYKQKPAEEEGGAVRFAKSRRRSAPHRAQAKQTPPQRRAVEDSPFAGLAQLRLRCV